MLPPNFQDWFAARGWQPRAAPAGAGGPCRGAGESVLLVAPTGGGKTLAGFLPTLIDLADRPKARAQARRCTRSISRR